MSTPENPCESGVKPKVSHLVKAAQEALQTAKTAKNRSEFASTLRTVDTAVLSIEDACKKLYQSYKGEQKRAKQLRSAFRFSKLTRIRKRRRRTRNSPKGLPSQKNAAARIMRKLRRSESG